MVHKNLMDFCLASMYLPLRPDLNPLGFGFGGVFETKVCAKPHSNLDSLKAAIVLEWTNMSKEFTIKTCSTFRPCLEKMLKANGNYFE